MQRRDHAEIFEAERGRLTATAYRMLGSWAEAEDAVQETWLRFSPVDLDEIREPGAWLTTVVGRVCLDVLRSARVRRESYEGHWLPEPVVTRLPDADATDPAEAAQRSEEISMALLVVLERLSPEQRVAFVLHDVFGVPFEAVAQTLGTSQDAARQLASRARRAVVRDGGKRRPSSLPEQQRVVSAFISAARSGDLEGLLEVLAPDVGIVADGGGVMPVGRPISGAVPVARFITGLFRRAQAAGTLELTPVLVNGAAGVRGEIVLPPDSPVRDLLPDATRTVRFVMSFEIVDGKIVAGFNQVNPAKLTRLPA